MSENVTTVNLLPSAGTLSDTDLLYLIQGDGENRDRSLKLQALKAYIENFSDISAKKITVVDSSDSRYSTTIEPRKTVYKSTATQGTPEVEIDSYFGKISLTDGSESSSITASGSLKLSGGTIKYSDDGSCFEFDKNVSFSYGEGDEAVYISANSANAYFVVSKGSGQGTRSTAIRATGISTTGTLSVNGTSSFSGNISVAGSANLNVVGGSYFSGAVEFSNSQGVSLKSPNGNSIQVSATNDYLQVGKRLHAQGNITTAGTYSIGGGSSAIVPKYYNATSGASSVTLLNGDFCFVHVPSSSSSSGYNRCVITESSSGSSTTVQVSGSSEFVAIVYKYGNKIFGSALV